MSILEPPPLDDEARAIIDAARAAHEPNEMVRARVRRATELKLAAGLGLAIVPVSSAFAGAAKVTLAIAAVGSVVGGVVGAGVVLSRRPPPAPVVAHRDRPARRPPAPPRSSVRAQARRRPRACSRTGASCACPSSR